MLPGYYAKTHNPLLCGTHFILERNILLGSSIHVGTLYSKMFPDRKLLKNMLVLEQKPLL